MDWSLLAVGAAYLIVIFGLEQVSRTSSKSQIEELPEWATKTLNDIEKGIDYL